jgi:hypothetical protein
MRISNSEKGLLPGDLTDQSPPANLPVYLLENMDRMN